LPNSEQVEFAHAAIDAGADMVIGHHPHVTQTVEKYKEKFIFYSLGNFIFDQMWSLETRRGLMFKARFDCRGLEEIELVPTLIENYAKPIIVIDENRDQVLDRLKVDKIDGIDYEQAKGLIINFTR
jgi:poly-gamma-glutamate synthesis protein (capsule biosynthesis protein)